MLSWVAQIQHYQSIVGKKLNTMQYVLRIIQRWLTSFKGLPTSLCYTSFLYFS